MSLREKAKFAKDICKTLADAYVKDYDLWNSLQFEIWVRLEDAEQAIAELKQKLQQLLNEFPSKDGGSPANWRVNMYSTREIDEWKQKFKELLKEAKMNET
jgi:hypothetical protein